MKKFYDRKNELALLNRIQKASLDSAQMTFLVGRRRIGKTRLILKAFENQNFLYFFLAKKNEALLCKDFIYEIKEKLKIPIYGEVKTFKEVFHVLIQYSKTNNFTLVIDEFQEFMHINPAIFSEMQEIWDKEKDTSKINLVLCGSIYSLMSKIFENAKEPLFGRATNRIHLKPFDIDTLKEILKDVHSNYTADDLFAFYLFTGGVAKYIELFIQHKSFDFELMLQTIVSENSLFLEEGKNVLIEEFGKDYGNYFSILSLIASGKTSRVAIESVMEMQIGGFLERLEFDYGIIQKVRPILSKPNSRSVKYRIQDNFLTFWFRFIYKYKSAIEIGNFDYLKNIIRRDYSVYSGWILEKYFTEKLILSKQYNIIGSYWESKNQNEIDIVAINEMKKKILFVEVKRKKSEIKIQLLIEKSENLQKQFNDYEFYFEGRSLDDL